MACAENRSPAGRLMALADVYDALVSARVYTKPLSHEEACEYIRQHSGTHFDPDVVAAFVARADEFAGIAREFREEMIVEVQRPWTPRRRAGAAGRPGVLKSSAASDRQALVRVSWIALWCVAPAISD